MLILIIKPLKNNKIGPLHFKMSQNPEMKEITDGGLKTKLVFLKNIPILKSCADNKSFYLI